MAKAAGATLLRGGAFKPRTSPYAFQGLGEGGLQILAEVRDETGLPVVTEVVDATTSSWSRRTPTCSRWARATCRTSRCCRPSARSASRSCSSAGMNATIEEWLMAAEYVAQRGNLDIVLCERGIRTFETATRNTLDISAVPVVARPAHLPVMVDPSHCGGRATWSCRCRGPRSPPEPTGSSSTSTRTRTPRCATGPGAGER